MKRFLWILLAILGVAILAGIGLSWARPDLVPPWARIGAVHSADDGHDHSADDGEGHDAGDGHGHSHSGDDGHGHGADDDDDDDGHGHGDEGAHGEEGHAEEAKLTPEAIERHGVRVAPVGKHVLVPTFTAPARVAYNAEAMAHVGSPVTGRVAELRVRVGDRVQKGDLLLVLQSPELVEAQSEYLQRLTAARTAAPGAELAQNALQRAERLRAETQGGIALNEVQKRQAESKAAESILQAARSAVTAAESKLGQLGMGRAAIEELARTSRTDPRYPISAPISGQVVEREVTLGELVDPQQESLLVLADLTTVWVLADVPEARSHEVTVGAKALVYTTGGAAGGLEGIVSFLAPALDPDTRTVPTRIVVRRGDAALRPGMFVRAQIDTTPPEGTPAAVLALPEAAVQVVEGKTLVFAPVVGEAGTFAPRPVVLGRVVGGMVPVLGGLEEGESVVVAGGFILKAELGKGGAEHVH